MYSIRETFVLNRNIYIFVYSFVAYVAFSSCLRQEKTRLEFHPEIRQTCLLLLNFCVKSATRTHGVTDSLKTLSCKSESTNSFARNKSVLLMREEVVITPVRRGGGILPIWSPVDRLAMHPSALPLTRKQLTYISSLSTLTISTPRPKSFPSRMALVFLQLRCTLYGSFWVHESVLLRAQKNFRFGSAHPEGLRLSTCTNNHQSI